MQHTTTRHRLRNGLLVVAVVAAAGGAYALTRTESVATVAPTIFKTAVVDEGSLSTTESIDGSLLLSDSTTVLHRIEGQTASASTGSTSGTGATGAPPAAGVSNAAATGVAAIESVEVADTCGPATGGPTTTLDPGATTTTVDPGTTTTTTSTPVDATDPGATTTTTPQPPPTTTTPCTTPPTTTPSIPGGFPTGGGAPTGGTGSTGGGTGAASAARVTQLVTSVIAVGSEVGIGTVLYSVESEPVIALAGSLPAWRTLDTDSDPGQDILQLEMNLVALGYDPDGTMTVNTEFDNDTEDVVSAWQTGYGMEATGVVELGSVVFVPSSAVASVDVAVGDEIGEGDQVLSLSSSSQQVVIDVPDGDEAALVPGLVVKIGAGEGTVTLLRSVEREGSVVVQAVITPTAAIEGVGNGQAVTVTVTLGNLDGVLTVPAEALVSRLDGSYALQVVAADGTSSFVAVELLGVAGSQVAVRGDGITAGTEVLQPL